MRGGPLPVLLLAAFLAGCAAPADDAVVTDVVPVEPLDPLAPGPHGHRLVGFDMGLLLAEDPDLVVYTYPVQVRGEATVPDGEGPFPVVLLVHGRHATCSAAGTEFVFTHVCPEAGPVEPVDSYTGYRYLAENLASHGFVVLSISANQINDRDLAGDGGANARGQLVHHVLADLVASDAGQGSLPELASLLDLDRVGLMGHSRGGEGVVTAAQMGDGDGYHIEAVFALAPTDFAHRTFGASVGAFAMLLPYCDGDVVGLDGARNFDNMRLAADRPAALHQVTAFGANHNFYNTVWTYDDGSRWSDDPWCGSERRESDEGQRRNGTFWMASFFRHYLAGDDFLVWTQGGAPEGAGLASSYATDQAPFAFTEADAPALGGAEADFCSPPACERAWTVGSASRMVFTVVDEATVATGPVSSFRAALSVGGPVRVLSDGQQVALLEAPRGAEAAKVVLQEHRIDAEGPLVFEGKGTVHLTDIVLR